MVDLGGVGAGETEGVVERLLLAARAGGDGVPWTRMSESGRGTVGRRVRRGRDEVGGRGTPTGTRGRLTGCDCEGGLGGGALDDARVLVLVLARLRKDDEAGGSSEAWVEGPLDLVDGLDDMRMRCCCAMGSRLASLSQLVRSRASRVG